MNDNILEYVNYIWLLFIVTSIIKAISWKVKSLKHVKENPLLKEGYNRLIPRWLLISIIPWIIMGIAQLSELTKGVQEFLQPSTSTPIVHVFYISILFYWILGSYWIFFKGGAQRIVDHPGLSSLGENQFIKSATLRLKLQWVLSIIVHVTLFCYLSSGYVQIPVM